MHFGTKLSDLLNARNGLVFDRSTHHGVDATDLHRKALIARVRIADSQGVPVFHWLQEALAFYWTSTALCDGCLHFCTIIYG